MDEEKLNDKKIKAFFKQDKIISKKVNTTFDNFINEIRKEEIEEKQEDSKVQEFPRKNNSFRKFTSLVASLVIVFLTSNAYAMTKGYNNIFFMIKEIYNEKVSSTVEFTDREILISYQPIYITDSIQLQINKLQVKDNEAKLYLDLEETNLNELTPLNYKVSDKNGNNLFEGKSSKQENDKEYTEELVLKNYNDEVNFLILDIYCKENKLLKNIEINLDDQTITAESVNEEIRKLSQIELNDFLEKQTKKHLVTLNNNLKNENKISNDATVKNKENSSKQDVIILKLVDLTYYNYTYIVQYLYCLPTEEDYENNNVENLDIYQNTIKFNIKNDEYNLLEYNNPEIFIKE